jgi:hypothetical protein
MYKNRRGFLKKAVCCWLIGLILPLLTVIAHAENASPDDAPAPSAAYGIQKLDGVYPVTASMRKGSTASNTVSIGFNKADLPDDLAKNDLTYWDYVLAISPIVSESDILETWEIMKSNPPFGMETTEFEAANIGFFSNICFFLLNSKDELIGALLNTDSLVTPSEERPSLTISFTAYRITNMLQPEQQTEAAAVSPSEPPADLPTASVKPAVTTAPVQTPAAAPETQVPSPESVKEHGHMTPGAVAGVTVAAVVVLAVGGVAGFMAANAAEVTELVRLAATAAAPGSPGSAAGASAVSKLKYPFIYFRLRKYSLLLGLKTEDSVGKLLKKQKLPFRSGGKAVMDLGTAMEGTTYTSFKIRHPKKAMNGKKDVTVSYSSHDDVVAQDHFASKDDFINVKYIERSAENIDTQ